MILSHGQDKLRFFYSVLYFLCLLQHCLVCFCLCAVFVCPWGSLAIPTTHCSSSNASVDFKSCFSLLNNQAVSCMPLEEARATNLDYRDTVYLGQFRSISESTFVCVQVRVCVMKSSSSTCNCD